MFDFFWNLAAFIIVLGVLVAIHEYGHFWVARRCNVKVHRFSIGFGKELFKKVDKHGTEFVVAAIPLGGYVKMLDGRVEEVAEHEQAFAFDKKSVWQRIAIVAAGPIANFLLAILAFWLMYLIGVNSAKPVMSGVQAASPARVITEQRLFQVSAVNGEAVNDWEALNLALVGQIGESSVDITITPFSEQGSFIEQAPRNFQLSLKNWHFNPKTESVIRSLGFIPFTPQVHLIAATVADNSAAQRSGLEEGDKLIALDKQPLTNWQDFVSKIQSSAGQNLALIIERNGQSKQLTLTPESRQLKDGSTQGYIGLSPQVDAYPEAFMVELRYGPIDAVIKGVKKTWQLTELTFSTLIKLVTGDMSIKNLSGPVGIAKGAGMSADYGIAYFLGFIALISVNLGIMNLIPLPVLDGGHLMYYGIEAVTGKPVSEKVQEVGFKIGISVLMAFMLVAILNDFNLL